MAVIAVIVGQWLQQLGWPWTCVSWPWTSNPLPSATLAWQKGGGFGGQAQLRQRKCKWGYSQVLWAGFNICGRWGCDRRIIASGLVTDGAGLSVNHGQARALSRTFLLLWSSYLSCTMSIGGSPVDEGISAQLYEVVFMLISCWTVMINCPADHHLCNGTATDVCKVCLVIRFGPSDWFIFMNHNPIFKKPVASEDQI